MAGALDKFFKKINFTDTETFKDTEVEKIVVHKLDNIWTIYISNDTPLNVEALTNLRKSCKNGFDKVKRVDLVIQNKNITDQDILSYMKYYMSILSTKSPALKSLKGNEITVNNGIIKIEITNKVEENLIISKKERIFEWFKKMGLPSINIETIANENKRKQVKEEIASSKKKIEQEIKKPSIAYSEKKNVPVLEVKGTALFGMAFESKFTPIKDINGAKRGIAIVAYITNIRAIESQRTDYKIFTIQVSDGETPFTCKLFTTDNNVYQFLLKNLKEGSWYKFKGSVQEDSYSHGLVLTIRSIMECDEKEMMKPQMQSSNKENNISSDYVDYGYIPEYIPPEDDYIDTGDAGFFAFDDEVPTPEYDFVGLEEELPKTIVSPKLEKSKETIDNHKEEEKKVETISSSNIIMGSKINGLVMEMKNQLAPINSCIFECKIFKYDLFESSKNNIKILTLKITDMTDSYIAKIFTKDAREFKRLSNLIKERVDNQMWIKIEGQIKYDDYAKDLVLTVRSIEDIPSKDIVLFDAAPRKRVELHTHTKMSQMDGLIDIKSYIKNLKKLGHRAVAITDHNGVQGFPVVFDTVNKINKGIEKDEDKFKVIYGTELVMIEDSINIVIRPQDTPSLDATYCVFDFETTGLNAGGEDSIIEIGAVLIKNGEIIERFDELINPGRPLPAKITEITNITDEMLKDKDNEENAVKRFIEFFKDYPMVAHNAKFDVSFLEMAYKKYNLGEFKNCIIDTLELSRALDNGFSRHSLSALVKRYNVEWDENAHHRGDYDAEGTAYVFDKMVKKMYNQNIENIKDFNSLVSSDEIYKYGRSFHVNILVKNQIGLKNLFKIISLANTKYLYKTPRILRSEITKYREGLLIGSGCYESEIFVQAKSLGDEELSNLISFYDYVEVQPPEVYSHLIDTNEFYNVLELQNHLKKIIECTKNTGKIIVATGDVHHYLKEDKISREIIVNQKVPGGGRHPLSKSEIKNIPSTHFRVTDEMLKDFAFLDEDIQKELVIDNTNKIADMCEIVEIIRDTHGHPFSPRIENSKEIVTSMVYEKAKSIYGDPLPELISTRIEEEFKGILGSGYDVIYLIAQKLVKHSLDKGYLVDSRGSVGSSFVATMMGVTEVNPLPAHYVCPNCKYTEFKDENNNAYSLNYASGYDLPDKKCPKCGTTFDKQGQDMPFATFLGFNADKVPDIDLNFSGDVQASAHEYTKELFGVDNVYRAGTVGTVAEKTAYGFVKGYCEEKGIVDMKSVEIERLALGCTGVKRTTGQHPGGIVVIPDYMEVNDFTPFQYPADDSGSAWRTTHFEYHSLEDNLLKLDILGHDSPTVFKMLQDLSGIDVTKLPLNDPDTMKLFLGPEILGVSKEDILCETGTLAVPEFGTKFVVKMLTETKPKTFAELVKISGLSHGTDVWAGNARDLIMNKVVEFKDVIGCRDDIMVTLINYGLEPIKAFKIMEFVRKGKASTNKEEWEEYKTILEENNVPKWYIDTCAKIKYMFPKAHACAYVISALRIAWFKVHMPVYYYATYYSVRCNDFDIETMCAGYDAIKQRFNEIIEKGFDAGVKETALADELQLAMEMCKRGISFKMIDLKKSDSKNFIIDEDGKSLIFPFRGLDGLGDNVSKAIIEERNKGDFISIEDLANRAKVNSTTIEKMRVLHILDGLPESNQLSLFD